MSVGTIGWKAYASLAKGYAKRAAKMYPTFVFGTGNDSFANAMKYTIKNRGKDTSWFTAVKNGFKNGALAAEKHNTRQIAKHGGFFKSVGTTIRTTPKAIKEAWTAGGAQAAKLGKNVLWGKFKGALKGVGTRMPLIGSLLLVAFELPNIFKATKDEGLVAGLGEIVKAGARVGGGTLCAAIGTALGGPLGGIVGFCVGDWITKKIVGQSYTERKYEEEMKLAEQQQAQGIVNPSGGTMGNVSIPGMSISPQELAILQQQLYGSTGGNIFEQEFIGQPNFSQLG